MQKYLKLSLALIAFVGIHNAHAMEDLDKLANPKSKLTYKKIDNVLNALEAELENKENTSKEDIQSKIDNLKILKDRVDEHYKKPTAQKKTVFERINAHREELKKVDYVDSLFGNSEESESEHELVNNAKQDSNVQSDVHAVQTVTQEDLLRQHEQLNGNKVAAPIEEAHNDVIPQAQANVQSVVEPGRENQASQVAQERIANPDVPQPVQENLAPLNQAPAVDVQPNNDARSVLNEQGASQQGQPENIVDCGGCIHDEPKEQPDNVKQDDAGKNQDQNDSKDEKKNDGQNPDDQKKNDRKFATIFCNKHVCYGLGAGIMVTSLAIITKKIADIDHVQYNMCKWEALSDYAMQQTDKAPFNSKEFYQLLSSIQVLNEDERELLAIRAELGNRQELIEFIQENKDEIFNRLQELSAGQVLKMKIAIYFKKCTSSVSSVFSKLKSVFSSEDDEMTELE